MAPRAIGALLALVAALAFVVSVASSAWWSGHPIVAGREIGAKDVRIGLLGATGCNTGGDGRCEPVDIGGGVVAAGYVELGVLAIATLLAFLVAASAWQIGERRRSLAKALALTAAIVAVGAAAVLSLGPDIQATQNVDVPIGWGVYVLGLALAAALASSAITARLEPEPLRLRPTLQPAPPVDVREMLREHGGLRPSSLGPEPMLGPGAAPTGPHQGRGSAPLIEGAPQLRPLYDPANAGYVPAPVSPAMPLNAPTPLPRSMVDAITGHATPVPVLDKPAPFGGAPATPNPGPPRSQTPGVPPPADGALRHGISATPAPGAPRPHTPSAPPTRTGLPSTPYPGAPRAHTPSPAGRGPVAGVPSPARANRPSVPPPARAKAPSASPPPRASAARVPPPARASAPSVPPPARASAPSVPPPARASAPSVPPPARASAPKLRDDGAGDGGPSGSPRARTMQGPGTDPHGTALERRPSSPRLPPAAPSASPTLAHAVPPMPSEAPSQRAATEADDRLETAMRETENVSVAEVEAAVARHAMADAMALRRTSTELDAQVGDATETNLHIAALAVADTGEDRALSADQISRASDEEPSIAKPLTIELAAQTTSGERPAVSRTTYELAAQTALSATDPLEGDSVRIGSLTDELGAQRMTDVMAAQGSLADQLAAQQHDGTDITDQSPSGRDSGHTPLPLHAARGPDHTPIPTQAPRAATPVPISTASPGLPPPRRAEATASGPTPACPQCESPMAWVDEHLRFYCKQCRMYF